MTKKEFLTAVTIIDSLPSAIKDFAVTELQKMEAVREKRNSAPSKIAVENAKLYPLVTDAMAGEDNEGNLKKYTAAEIGEALNVSTAKASALLREMVSLGTIVEIGEVKSSSKSGGKVKAYVLND